MKSSWALTWVITYPIFRWLFGIRIHDRRLIPKKKAVLIAANHMSFADPPLMGHAAKRECFFLAKEELFAQSRFFRWLIACFNAIPIKRGKAFDIQLFRKINQLIRKGQAIILFPEGTRSLKGTFLPFKSGVGMLALRYNIPVVPTYIKNTHRPWHEWLSRRSRVEVFFAEPIYPECPSKNKEAYEKFTLHIEREVHRLAAIAHGRVNLKKTGQAASKASHKPVNPENQTPSARRKADWDIQVNL